VTLPRPLLPALTCATLAALCACGSATAQAPKDPGYPVRVQPVEVKDMPRAVRAIGTMQASSVQAVHSQITGVLTHVHFTEGSEISKDQLLFTIDQRPFEQALAQSVAAREKDKAALVQAQANVERDEAQRRNAELEAVRYLSLLKQGMASQEQADEQKTNEIALQATVAADRAAVNTAQAQLVADDSFVESAKLQLSYCFIHSPIDGRAGALAINEGNLVTANASQLVTINCIKPLYANFAVPEAELDSIRENQAKGALQVSVTANGPGATPHAGALQLIDNQVDPTTGTINLRAVFPNVHEMLWPGQFVNIDLVLATEANAVVVPSQAIQTGQIGTYVYLLGQDGAAELRPVTVERLEGSEAVLKDGLKAGEQVVVDGQMRLTKGSRLNVIADKAEGAGAATQATTASR
jgi:multidrug efflux system membrane fusion protein